ncbi:MAG: translation initiation factor IF-2 [Gemmatimonadota bacterium]
MKYRVYEIAEELGVESGHLIQMLRAMDVPVRSHMSVVEPGQVARLHARLERERRMSGKAPAAEVTATRKRRRRRVAPAAIQEVGEVDASTAEASVEVETEAVETTSESESAAVADIPASDGAVMEEGAEGRDEAAGVAAQATLEEAPPAQGGVELEVPAAEATQLEEEVAVTPAPAEEWAADSEAAPEAEMASPEGAAPPAAAAGEAPARGKRRPKPARRGMPKAPTASAAPDGTVQVKANGFASDGRKKSRRERKKRGRVDQGTVQENVKKTLAALGGGGGRATGRRKRRESSSAQQAVEQEERAREVEREKETIRVNEFLTVAELADLMDTTAQAIITSAFKNLGLMVTINQRLDFDQIELICEEAGVRASREQGYDVDVAEAEGVGEEEGPGTPRAPVVTVMGHVDHGKTSLLDYIRRANVIAGEAGGITQHIGAYHVELDDGRALTFLDTPGHEAFTAMRARGAELTDIVILVVAADDAVMPQTIEAISHAKNAGVPIVVAINKIDLPGAKPDKVKQDLLGQGVVLEEFGGDVLAAEVSAKTGQGVPDLLEKVLLQAELLEIEAQPDRSARGTVVEAELDRGMGPVATVLVQNGTLRVGDDFVCGLFGGRVRALLDERGNNVPFASPGIPVRVLGVEGVPQAGDALVAVEVGRVRGIIGRRQQLEREKDMRRRGRTPRLEDLFGRIKLGEQSRLSLIIKADTDGSAQALADALERLGTDEVAVEVIHRGVGGINESDVLLATTTAAAIVGFHVRPDAKAQANAERDGVEIRVYDVIYEAVEDVRLALEGMLSPEVRETTVGMAEVRQLFRVRKVGTVAGCYVSMGTIRRNLPVRLLRDQVQIYEGRLASLKRFKEDVREVKDGYECGLSIEDYNDIKVGDIIECYEVQEVARTLTDSSTG